MSYLSSSSISRHSNRGRGRGDIHHPTQKYQSRASTTPSPGLISSNFQGHPSKTHLPLSVTQPNRVLLPGAGAQMMYSLGGTGPVVPNNMLRAAAPQQIFTTQQYPGVPVPWPYIQSNHSTQQPINLGTQPHSSLSLQQSQHAIAMAMVAARSTPQNMMGFPTPEQAQPQSQPPQQHLQSDSATRQKRPSKAIKIVNPDTHTEVDVRGGNQETKAVRPVAGEAGTNLMAQEFKSKVHAASVGAPGEPIVGGSLMGGVASGVFIPEMHRPNAIITDPDASKPKQVGVAYQSVGYIVQDVVGEGGAQSGIVGGEGEVRSEKTIGTDMVDSSGGPEPTMTAEGEKGEKEDGGGVGVSGGTGNEVQGRTLDDEVPPSSSSGGLISVDSVATSSAVSVDNGATSSVISVDSGATSSAISGAISSVISGDSGATSSAISVDNGATSSVISVDSGATSSAISGAISSVISGDSGAISSVISGDSGATSSAISVDSGASSSGGLNSVDGATSSAISVDSGATSSGGLISVDSGATSSGGLISVDSGASSSVDSGATSNGSQLADHTGVILPEIGMSTIGESSPTNIETVATSTPPSSTVIPMDARDVAELGTGSREQQAKNLNSEPAPGDTPPESALLTSAMAPEPVCPIRDVPHEPVPLKSVPPQEPALPTSAMPVEPPSPTSSTPPPSVAPTSLDEGVVELGGVAEEASETSEKTSVQSSQPSSAVPEKEGVLKSTVSNKAISDHAERTMGPNKNNINSSIGEPIEQAKAVWIKQVDPLRSSHTHHVPTWATANEGEEETLFNNAGDGRKMYEREFLMRFKDLDICKEVPAGLKSSLVLSMDTLGAGAGGYTSRPNEKRGPMSSRRIIDHKKVISHQPQMERKVELNKASVPWTRAADNVVELTEEQISTAELYRKFQGILNKLTPQKFTALAEQALKLEITNEERLSGCIDKIFTKALEEPSFSIAYANLCKVMSPIKAEWVLEGKTRTNNFRRMLLTKCQKEFQKDDESLETMQAEIDKAETEEKRKVLTGGMRIAMDRMRKRSLGNIRFIGELFKLQMLSETILHECITRLLKSTSDEESLECFARLITTTGKDLDKHQAKGRIDTYFNRITDIIKKGKVPARVRFMLQDIIELRSNKWIPRERQDQQLKTIDQIHAEAKLEEAKEKEMVQQHQVISIKGGGGGGRDFRRVKDDHPSKDRERRERFEATKLTKLINSRQKDKACTGPGHLGPMRPNLGWKKGSAISSSSQPVEPPKILKPVTRSVTGPVSKSRAEGRQVSRTNVLPGPKRSHTAPTPEYERECMLSAANEFANPSLTKMYADTPTDHQGHAPSRDAPAQAILCSDKRLAAAPPTSADDDRMIIIVQRKITSTIDELVNNADYKEAIECVKEIDLPGAMRQLVFEGINHTLERKTGYRSVTGELFSQLVQQKIISPQDFSEGLDKVLEVAEDMCIDIPKIWDYLGEVLAPVFARGNISLSFFKNPNLVRSGHAPLLAAKVLQRCGRVLGESESEEVVKDLWLHSGLHWDDLGKEKEHLEEFLEKHNLSFLVVKEELTAVKELPKSKLDALHQLLISPNATNDDVNTWIKNNCSELDYSSLVTSLSSAVVRSSVTGSGDTAILQCDLFDKRMEVVKAICKEQEHHGVDVLYGLQCSVTKLSHPPSLLSDMFNAVYNLDLVAEKEFYKWKVSTKVMYGKGNAVHSVKRFFDWLKSDESQT